MQVVDIIDEYNGRPIKLGTAGGSGFLYCGIVSESLPFELMDIWSKAKAQLDARIRLLKQKYAKASTYEMYYRKNRDLFPTQLQEIDRAKAHLETATMWRKASTNILKREVVEVYPSLIDKEVSILLIEGFETGRAWDYSEWVRGCLGR